MVDKKTGHIIPYYETAIVKKELHIRNAWEIGENDLDMVVMKSTDLPIIPSEVKNAPVLDLLKKKKSKYNSINGSYDWLLVVQDFRH